MSQRHSFALGLAMVGLVVVACSQTSAGSFGRTGSMSTARYNHTATRLQDGRVLIVGGQDSSDDCLASAELYDPNAGAFTPAGSMGKARAFHSATLLLGGRVLVAGGYAGTTSGAISEAELYDPKTGTFLATGSMTTQRSGHSATLLSDGQVLVVGGGQGANSGADYLASAELYNPATGTFSRTGSMTHARVGPAIASLAGGRVLIAGGGGSGPGTLMSAWASAELYDPGRGTFSSTGSMTEARGAPSATVLPDGRVLIVGGADASAELYDPKSGTFAATGSMSDSPTGVNAVLLLDGRVFVLRDPDGNPELYDPRNGVFSFNRGVFLTRWAGTATLLPDGQVLIAGGGRFASAEANLYQP